MFSELIEYYHAGGLDTTEELELALLLRDQDNLNSGLEGLVTPFNNLKDLKISCVCSKSTLMFLLLHCPALTSLFIGSNTDLCNDTIAKVSSRTSEMISDANQKLIKSFPTSQNSSPHS